ncbi:MAG: Gfo/Idh/MocA family oxidoreductase [Actinomycetota bacterium]|nr:Gfo/Idh/MocA family oxidoreductase [Actinomycetota bacterium]
MRDDLIRWGILGAGEIAATVSADIAASPGSALAAVGARDGERAAAFAQGHGLPRSYGSYRELVADPDIDIVYVATTHAQHYEHALLALEAGKPVLVEKAFTLTGWQAREVVAAARSRKLFCMEAMWMRLHVLVREAQRIAAAGQIGEIVSVRAELSRRFEFDPQHRLFDLGAGGGALLDLGIYPVTFAWLFLGKPERIQAAGTLSPTGSDATVAMQSSYSSGAVAQVLTSAVSTSPAAALICGTEGWIEIGPSVHRPTVMTVHTSDGDKDLTAELPGNGYRLQVAEVERCLRAGELESPLVPQAETVAILETIDDVRRQVGARYPADRDDPNARDERDRRD